jgi:MYXO-CTERM domain-containing protein
MKTIQQLLGAALLVALSGASQAALVQNPAGYWVVEDFEAQDGLVISATQTLPSGVTLTPNGTVTLGAYAADLGDNGTWGAGNHFLGAGDLSLNSSAQGYGVTLQWSSAQQGVGAWFSAHSAMGVLQLDALGAAGETLESYTLTAPNAGIDSLNQGQFWGVQRAQADIFGLQVRGSTWVMDDLSQVSPVPAPAALPMMLSGLVALWWTRRRRSPSL